MSESGIAAKNKITKEMIVLSIIVILYSLQGLPTLNFNAYYIKFAPAPQKLIFARFLLSITIRVILLISGIGVIFRKDIFRKAIIYMSLFTIATIYWKHPAGVFRGGLIWLTVKGVIPVTMITKFDMIAWICVVICYFVDIVIGLGLIYLFTRPKIKEQFK